MASGLEEGDGVGVGAADVVSLTAWVVVLLASTLVSTGDRAMSTMLYLFRAAPRLSVLTETAADSIWVALSRLTAVATSMVPERRCLRLPVEADTVRDTLP